MKYLYLIVSCILFSIVSCSQKKENDINGTASPQYKAHDLSMYPPESDSLNRHIIFLPIEENENLYRLEIWAGQLKMVDCNKHQVSGNFVKKVVKGWGYPYYEFHSNQNHMSTLMACPDNTLTEKFIRSNSEHLRYNSKLPVVIYCPKELEIEYAIWSKNDNPFKAPIK